MFDCVNFYHWNYRLRSSGRVHFLICCSIMIWCPWCLSLIYLRLVKCKSFDIRAIVFRHAGLIGVRAVYFKMPSTCLLKILNFCFIFILNILSCWIFLLLTFPVFKTPLDVKIHLGLSWNLYKYFSGFIKSRYGHQLRPSRVLSYIFFCSNSNSEWKLKKRIFHF